MSNPSKTNQIHVWLFQKAAQNIFILINLFFAVISTKGNINQTGWFIHFNNGFYLFSQMSWITAFSPGLSWFMIQILGEESEHILKWIQRRAAFSLKKVSPALKTRPTRSLNNYIFPPLSVKSQTDPADQKDECVISRQPAAVNGIMNRHMSGWSVESTQCKRWAWGDALSGRLPRFVLAWHGGGHGWAKWGRRNTYSQFPRIRGRSSLSRSQGGERETDCYGHKTS